MVIHNLNKHNIDIYIETEVGTKILVSLKRFHATQFCDVTTVEEYAGFVEYGNLKVPKVTRKFGDVILPENLPENGYLLVNSFVLEAAKANNHPLLERMIAPDTGSTALRKQNGQVEAVTRFVGA